MFLNHDASPNLTNFVIIYSFFQRGERCEEMDCYPKQSEKFWLVIFTIFLHPVLLFIYCIYVTENTRDIMEEAIYKKQTKSAKLNRFIICQSSGLVASSLVSFLQGI